MKEHPIIFSSEIIKAILEGRKTQTRRPLKDTKMYFVKDIKERYQLPLLRDCPYGQVGDRLWVRESYGYLIDGSIAYRANCDPWHLKHGYTIKWKPSIYMFRKDSRITLEITEVRVERLQKISYRDSKSEGCISISDYAILWDSLNAKCGYGWDINPWCWVLEFKILEKDKE